jgi:hypothetical protein
LAIFRLAADLTGFVLPWNAKGIPSVLWVWYLSLVEVLKLMKWRKFKALFHASEQLRRLSMSWLH